MLRKILTFTACLMILGCTAPVQLRVMVDQTCVLPKIRLDQATLAFLASLYDRQGRTVTLEATSLDGQAYRVEVPEALKADIGQIRKQGLAHDRVCKGPAAVTRSE